MVAVGLPGSTRELVGVADGIWLMNGPGETEVDIVATPSGGFAFLETTGQITRTGISATWDELGTNFV
ncbi:MAG: hypothetical protein JWN70_2583 [Planctomycetaceae bacterium]|nr:hypothetical protein [Planctomycetaceae bacterium]